MHAQTKGVAKFSTSSSYILRNYLNLRDFLEQCKKGEPTSSHVLYNNQGETNCLQCETRNLQPKHFGHDLCIERDRSPM